MQASDETLAGYQKVHGRPPAFEGSDGRAYSVGVFSDDDPGVDGRYGASLLFVRWSKGQEPEGHIETDYLVRAATPTDAETELGRMRLIDIKRQLDALIKEARS